METLHCHECNKDLPIANFSPGMRDETRPSRILCKRCKAERIKAKRAKRKQREAEEAKKKPTGDKSALLTDYDDFRCSICRGWWEREEYDYDEMLAVQQSGSTGQGSFYDIRPIRCRECLKGHVRPRHELRARNDGWDNEMPWVRYGSDGWTYPIGANPDKPWQLSHYWRKRGVKLTERRRYIGKEHFQSNPKRWGRLEKLVNDYLLTHPEAR